MFQPKRNSLNSDAPKIARPAADRVLTAIEDVAREIARRDRIVEDRRFVAIRVLEAVASEDLIAPGAQRVIEPDVELVDVVVEDAV